MVGTDRAVGRFNPSQVRLKLCGSLSGSGSGCGFNPSQVRLKHYRQTAVNHGRVLQSLTGPSETTGTQSGSVSVWTLQSLTGPSETWADVDFTGPESSASIPHRSV